jgi:hypothetical protein
MTALRLRLLTAAAVLACLVACSRSLPTGAAQPLFYLSRVTVQDLTVDPATATAGETTRIRFALVRAGGDAGAPLYWTAYFMESPAAGGAVSLTSGGPVASGDPVEIVYTPKAATTALFTIYPSSSPNTKTGDGTGDWRSFAVTVH